MRRVLVLFSVTAVLAALAAAPAAAAQRCLWRDATLVGTTGPDRLIGTAGDDVIVGLGGSDRIEGLGGHDRICAGTGHDVVFGGPGADIVRGGGGNDRIGGAHGEDSLFGDAGADRLYGAAFLDNLYGGEGNDFLSGGDHFDDLDGGPGGDVLNGGGSDDTLSGGSGRDRLYGAVGNDLLRGERGRDHINGGSGRDSMWLTSPGQGVHLDLALGEFVTVDGTETVARVEDVLGTVGDDVLKGDEDANYLSGAGVGYDRVEGRGGNDELSGSEALGGAGNDRLSDVYGPTKLWGGPGDDAFSTFGWRAGQLNAWGGSGADLIHLIDDCDLSWTDCENNNIRFAGGDGLDRIFVTLWSEPESGPRGNEPYRFDLPAGAVTNTATGMVTHVRDVEDVVGTPSDDTIIGTAGPNRLIGGQGGDTIRGAGGNDTLAGGNTVFDDGSDTLDAGPGAGDDCYTSSPPQGVGPPDTISRCETIHAVRAVR